MRISDWSSDVCSSDLRAAPLAPDKRIADALDVRPRAAIERAGAAVNEGKAVRRPDEGGNGFPCRAARRALDRLRQIVRHHRTQPVDAPHRLQPFLPRILRIDTAAQEQIGRTSVRAQVCPYVSIMVVAVSLKK